jgi:hypothetical protein
MIRAWPRLVVVLFAIGAAAVLGGAVLTVVAVAEQEPERCCSGPVAAPAALPSPTTAPAGTRPAGPPHCLIGSWQVVEEEWMFAFYNDEAPIRFTTAGSRTYEYRPDGTVVQSDQNAVMSANWQGRALRMEYAGTRALTWTIAGDTITYHAITSSSQTVNYYDHRGHVLTWQEPVDPNFNKVYQLSCSGNQVLHTDGAGHRALWQRTANFGTYG